MIHRSLAHRAPLLGLVVAWGLGAVLAHRGVVTLPAPAWAGLALAGLVIAWLGRTRGRLWVIGLLLALAAAGALRTDQNRARPTEWDALGLPPREARLTLRVERLFASAEPGRVGGLATVTGTENHLRDIRGQRIQFFATQHALSPRLFAGVEFSAVGVLRLVPEHPPAGGDDFDRYLADSGVNFSFNRARLEMHATAPGGWRRFCQTGGDRLEHSLRLGLTSHEELADLYVAMMLGQKQELSATQKDLFIRSGTMHLFAISGLHIAGIALALNTLLAVLRMSAGARFVVGTALLWTYVEITGGEPSAVRAFWMVTCLLGARRLRAPGNSLSALAVSALAVLVLDPHQLFSASFQMSYGIVAALLLYGVPLQERWLAAWQPWARQPKAEWTVRMRFTEWVGRGFLGAVALGLAATLVSTPAALGFFGLMAPGGFFVNLLLIPLSTLVLFAGVAAMAFGGLGLESLAYLFNHAAALLLAAMQGAVDWSLRVPGVSWPAEFVAPWLAGATSVGLLTLLAFGYARGWKKREGGYWAPFVVLGLVLVLGVRGVSVAAP